MGFEVSRRSALLAALAVLAAGSAAACAPETPPEVVDALQEQLDRAEADRALAERAAAAPTSPFTPALSVIAAQRREHAHALAVEIARAAGRPAPTDTSTAALPGTTAAPPPSPTGPPPPPPTARDVGRALQESARRAADLAAEQTGYRAGLLASISACCTAAAAVPLDLGEDT